MERQDENSKGKPRAKEAPPPQRTAAPAVRRPPAYPGAVDRLIAEFNSLPGIGRRSAERLAFHILKADEPSAMGLARAISDVKKTVRHCRVCSNFSDSDLCAICAQEGRDRARVLVV